MYDKIYYPYPSTDNKHKFFIITNEGKKVNFGAKGYEDFTIHKNEDRKRRYILRHKPKEERFWNNPNTKSFWSKNLLWNKPTLKESYKDIHNHLKSLGYL